MRRGELCVGSIRAFYAHLGQALNDGVTWFDVLDAHSADMALYLELLQSDHSSYTEVVESMF